MKPRLFLGSSSEQLTTLNEIQKLIGDVAECVPWTNAFSLNKSGLDSLIKQTRLSDFAILIATKDDLTNHRGEEVMKPRDNVIFEFGLFFGATGSEKCFLFAEEGADLPSDLDGITVAKFTRISGQYNSLDKLVETVKSKISQSSQLSELGLLPSTALAIGYYNSFVKKVCEEVHRTQYVSIDSKKVKVRDFLINVIIPESLDDNGVADFTMLYNRKHQLQKASTYIDVEMSSQGRGYAFHFKVEPTQEGHEEISLQILDVPGTLSTIVESLKLYIPAKEVGTDFDVERLEKRELFNFAKTLKYLVGKNSITKGNVKIHTDVTI
ncbi:putative nucleotide-binding protein with TIR-like domain [Chitinophaga polysaccharea]|uniref:CD-NTase-associated protein 12 n=1 Tax=Chitinophaga polysaccharea TaxID=1293035 RepID=A0A561PNC4_9BACT|nr:STING domain-containing protein [Chitinophaga polysaccharea]TWF39616.1 putative nucleotide-binding protein with TIR-like domain [Chitinophaga polysaccharea]